jgi:hypothetical protein
MIIIIKMTKIVILSYFPYKNQGEVKIRSFVQEISLFLNKTYLLNTIKPILGHEIWSLEPKQHNLKKPMRWLPLGT